MLMEELSLDKTTAIHKSKNSDAPWIVFVNGLFADYNSWDQAISLLGDNYHILRYNSRGQGGDESLKSIFSLSEQVHYLVSLLDRFHISKATIIGISNGGRVALSLAQNYPARVQRIFVADSYAKLDEGLKYKLESWLSASRLGGNELRFKVSTPWIFGDTFLEQKPEVLDYFLKKVQFKNQENSEYLILSALEDDEINLERIRVPVHFLVGEEDRLTPPEKHLEMHQQTLNSTLDIIRGGHASLLEYPENISDYILPVIEQERI